VSRHNRHNKPVQCPLKTRSAEILTRLTLPSLLLFTVETLFPALRSFLNYYRESGSWTSLSSLTRLSVAAKKGTLELRVPPSLSRLRSLRIFTFENKEGTLYGAGRFAGLSNLESIHCRCGSVDLGKVTCAVCVRCWVDRNNPHYYFNSAQLQPGEP
jgi:hypothetical protein